MALSEWWTRATNIIDWIADHTVEISSFLSMGAIACSIVADKLRS